MFIFSHILKIKTFYKDSHKKTPEPTIRLNLGLHLFLTLNRLKIKSFKLVKRRTQYLQLFQIKNKHFYTNILSSPFLIICEFQ